MRKLKNKFETKPFIHSGFKLFFTKYKYLCHKIKTDACIKTGMTFIWKNKVIAGKRRWLTRYGLNEKKAKFFHFNFRNNPPRHFRKSVSFHIFLFIYARESLDNSRVFFCLKYLELTIDLLRNSRLFSFEFVVMDSWNQVDGFNRTFLAQSRLLLRKRLSSLSLWGKRKESL